MNRRIVIRFVTYVVTSISVLVYVCPAALSVKHARAFLNNGYIRPQPSVDPVGDIPYAFDWNLDDSLVSTIDYIANYLELRCKDQSMVLAVEYGVALNLGVTCKDKTRLLNPILVTHSQKKISCSGVFGKERDRKSVV